MLRNVNNIETLTNEQSRLFLTGNATQIPIEIGVNCSQVPQIFLLILKYSRMLVAKFGGIAKMKEQRLSAYLDLIQALLSCPEGEEWNLLHQHEELVNTEFVQVMEQVAQQIASDGNLDVAKFLYYWVGQLNHVLMQAGNSQDREDKIQPYLNLIYTLLDSPNGKEGEVLAAHQDLIDSRFVHLLRQVAKQMATRGANSSAIYLSNLATKISRQLAQQADIFKPKFEQESKIKYPLNNEQLQGASQREELLSGLNNNYNYANSKANTAVATPPEYNTLINQDVEKAANTIAESLQTSANLPQSDLKNEQVLETPSTVPSDSSDNKRLDEILEEISQSFSKLERILNARLQTPNPLWYMDVLERAQSSNWLLTSEEIEKLIGVKPKCEAGKDSFQRGCWIFTKAGKMGLQTAWRISK
ncbi:MAG: hypothetical protein RMX68_000870 [Aulosira sp. ZfuVER01]|nr:hypothetical protein [Aulosira sp. ZfuVER01]MDZ7998617.1 hypothetical protein [Aulosira sp. DedVER01a]MDZ8052038.1 hypothetical protein [Aulosira sp. ZfuCHP01]